MVNTSPMIKPSSSARRIFTSAATSGAAPHFGWQARIRDAMVNGTDSYRDIDNAFSAGGHDGRGSPQTRVQDSGLSDLPDVLPDLSDKNKPAPPPPKPKPRVSHGGSGGSSAKRALQYYEAPLAEYYGFGKETAYQEALANTAYRRELNDMRKAGLNPSVIYGSHNTTGADSNAIPRSSGGGGGGGSRRYGSSQKGLSKVAYYGIQLASTAVGAILGGVRGASIGSHVGLTASRLIGALKGR